MNHQRPPVGFSFERLSGLPIDLLYITLPVPRMACLPGAVRRRLRKAERNALLTTQAILQILIERLEEAEENPRPKVERIAVE